MSLPQNAAVEPRSISGQARPLVLVVGLGPAGASAAAAAAAGGCRVIAVDRRRSVGEPLQCAELVSAAFSVDGVGWDGLTAQPIRCMISAVEQQAPRTNAQFYGRMICRPEFDRTLVARAVAQGAHIRLGVSVSRVGADGSVCLSNGERIEARVLIGADGPRSVVGSAIGTVNRELVAARQITLPLPAPYHATDIFLRAAYPGGYGWLFPIGRCAHVGVGLDFAHRHRLKVSVHELQAQLAAQGRVSAAASLALTGGLIPAGGRLRCIGRLRSVMVLLAGDAAGLTNPVTGAGIEAAVRSGALAGGAAAHWLAGRADAVDDYESELSDLYDGAYGRALRRRRALLDAHARGRVAAEDLWRGWIASPGYWSEAPIGDGQGRCGREMAA